MSTWVRMWAAFGLILGMAAGVARGQTLKEIGDFSNDLVQQYRFAFTEQAYGELEKIHRRLREVNEKLNSAKDDTTRQELTAKGDAAAKELATLLEQTSVTMKLKLNAEGVTPPNGGRVNLPGDNGGMLLKVDLGEGPTQFIRKPAIWTEMFNETAGQEVALPASGTAWVMLWIVNAPANRTTMMVRFKTADGKTIPWPVDLIAPKKARLKVTILDDDTGQPTPAMVRLTWKTGGFTDCRPSNALHLADQFEHQGNWVDKRPTNLPHPMGGDYYCVPGPFDMMISPGEFRLTIRRGIEHVPMAETLNVEPGAVVEKTYRVRRWTDMRKRGWYSGDDHVHNRIVSDDDARRLMTWIKAEDVHVANVVKMGDINRTWFEQRGFGPSFRVIDGDYVLSPGQECPRTHNEIGHTISMNITSMVRDTDRYFSYDWVADQVHQQGGLWGYAHMCSGVFWVYRDMTMNIPAGRVDFGELLQFFFLGTELYYEFLNSGFKVTASAGSDVPWAGTVGEARMYAYVGDRTTGDKPFSVDDWFDAVRRGHTFVSDGPMVELSVDDARPGDELVVDKDRKLRVQARAWGDPSRMLPIQLEIIQHGEVIRTAKSEGKEQSEVKLDFELDAGQGFWLAAKVVCGDGTKAHTTPVYVTRKGLRFWKFDQMPSLFAKADKRLLEVTEIVDAARRRVKAEKFLDDRATIELAEQGDVLLERVARAKAQWAELKATYEREKTIRGQ